MLLTWQLCTEYWQCGVAPARAEHSPYRVHRGMAGGCGQWGRRREEPSEVLLGSLDAAWGRVQHLLLASRG